jgi:hypothetical protein
MTAPEVSVASTISYQGFLRESGVPVTGSRDILFRLYTDGTCTTQVGSDILKKGVSVADGLFTANLAVDQSDFNGQAIWLRVIVGGSGLGCQEILPVPYALSLRPGAEVSGSVADGSAFSAHNDGSGMAYGASFTGYSGIYVEAPWDGIYVHDAGEGLDVNQAGTGIHLGIVDTGINLDTATNMGITMNSVTNHGIQILQAGNDGIHAQGGTNQSTDYGGWFKGYNGVYGQGTGASGYGGEFVSNNTHGVYVDAGAGVTDHGVYVAAAGGQGVYVGPVGESGIQVSDAGTNGVHVLSAGEAGVYVESAGTYGVYAESSGDHAVYGRTFSGASTDYGGYFEGFHGVYGKGNGATGFGGRFESSNNHGVYATASGNFHYGAHIESTNGHSVYVTGGDDFGDAGVYVDQVAGDGVHVYAADNWGVYADTTASNNEWGLRTPDKLYVGTTMVSAGALTMVAQNGGQDRLEVGDVVAAAGVGAPFADSDVPIPLVRLADANYSAVIGVVDSRFVVEERVSEVERDGRVEQVITLDSHSTEGAAAPGEYLLIVVLGAAEVKVDASAGAIAAGERLTVSEAGGQVRALQTRMVEGMTVTEGAPSIGYALEAPDTESGTVLVFVTLR